uniref:Uncharacterized protein n=1 Tax=Arundo donax TaxID=35708 RepID=A0A0A9GIU5_ARUDO
MNIWKFDVLILFPKIGILCGILNWNGTSSLGYHV